MVNTQSGHCNARDAEWRRLASLYDRERHLFEIVSARFREEGTLSSYDFFAIVIWKSNRSKTKIKRGLEAAGKTVGALMREVALADTPVAKLETLLTLHGIGLAIASAILTVCYPEDFMVLDYRAWDTLKDMSVQGLPHRYPQTCQGYLQYCEVCQQLANQTGLSLRNLDRALWAKSWENGLLELSCGTGVVEEPDVSTAQRSEPAQPDARRSKSTKIHVEVYLAGHMLESEKGTFQYSELVERVRTTFGDTRSGVMTHATAHCVANANKNTGVAYNYLWRIDHGCYRCFDPMRDVPHPSRVGGRLQPKVEDVPVSYRHLLRQ